MAGVSMLGGGTSRGERTGIACMNGEKDMCDITPMANDVSDEHARRHPNATLSY
jgi:hypothetical protein